MILGKRKKRKKQNWKVIFINNYIIIHDYFEFFIEVRQDNLDLKEDKFFKKAPSNNNAVSKDISATNLVQTPFILRTDVSKEFLEQEGKNSRKNVRNPRPKNMININNKGITENMVASIQNQNQNLNYNIFSHDQNSNNHGNDALDIQMQRENEIQSIKNDAKNQQKNMQQKLFEIQV